MTYSGCAPLLLILQANDPPLASAKLHKNLELFSLSGFLAAFFCLLWPNCKVKKPNFPARMTLTLYNRDQAIPLSA
jgi:hypothetical protein